MSEAQIQAAKSANRARCHYILREKITFKPSTYYIAMFFNLILRFLWLLGIFTFSYDTEGWKDFDKLQGLTFISLMGELIRRTAWSIIRIENQIHNDFEAYRTI
jgi:hypothetical protein